MTKVEIRIQAFMIAIMLGGIAMCIPRF